jgi:phosphatidylglycerophosphate synthase
LARLPLALAIAGIVGVNDGLVGGAVLLSAAWMTDLADGRLARRAASATRLGPWDPIADATVGMGVLVGLIVAGRVGIVPWLVIGGVLFAGFIVTRNLALGMVVQALAYGLFIVELAIDAPHALWMPGATAAVIGIADAGRFVDEILPNFFSGLGLAGRRHRND